ncbi:hypothetical protein H6P81_003993 [Aristolochia fimbriata]|uniref:Pectinesterase inhibitor domain-containing protein n=1 Tax=Aristolochia fimbriata TaxID=158543 RepID=A0AAV7FE57_ARIFI|nr:hypothetical protein H6P81_003993 [Aristolochia fimbriata]
MAALRRYTVLFAALAVALLSHPSSGRSLLAVPPRRSPPSGPSPDIVGFVQGVVQVAITIGSDTYREIDVLVSQTKDEKLKTNLYTCQTLYAISTERLHSALLPLKNKSFIDAKALINDANAGLKCEGFFEKSPLTTRNGVYEQLRTVTLSSFDLLV